MKPIETGCVAETRNCVILVNNGARVRVGKFLGILPEPHLQVNYWETDQYFITTKGNYVNYMQECKLFRVDGGETKLIKVIAKAKG